MFFPVIHAAISLILVFCIIYSGIGSVPEYTRPSVAVMMIEYTVSSSPKLAHSSTVTPGSIHRGTARVSPFVPARAYTAMERCCSTCTYHLHRDAAVGLSACGRCVFHLRCTASLDTCEQCCVPVGTVDTEVLMTCNSRGCSAKGGVLCPSCAAELATRFEAQLCRMERLSRASAIGWLTSFGNLKRSDLEAVVAQAWTSVETQLRADYRVCYEDGLFMHFTTRLYQLSRGQVYGSISYTDLLAYLPSLPPEAAGVLRRFVAENRRYWHEHPRSRMLNHMRNKSISKDT